MEPSITFHRIGHPYRLHEIGKTRRWLQLIVEAHDREVGEIAIILCTDDALLDLNRSALNHDYYTDIITFDHCVGDVVSGDLYISVDRVKENAKNLGQTVKQEMLRVCAHGVLHLCGYGDKTTEEAATMRKKEDQWLNVFHVEHP
jgi:rRNA maturation RNase YbeY